MRHVTLVLALLAAGNAASASDLVIGNRDTAALRRAIATAAADPDQAYRIVLAAGGIYTLSDTLPGRLGLPPLAGKITIDGRGAEIRRYSDRPMTLLQVDAGATVSLANLTLSEGSLGAIRNLGSLTLDHVKVTDNSGEGARGIIVNHGTLVARDTEISHNEVHGSGRDAGTLVNFGTLTLSKSLIARNSLSRRYPSLATAAVLNHGQLTLADSNFTDNSVIDEFGGLVSTAVLNLMGGRVEGDAATQVRDESNDLALN